LLVTTPHDLENITLELLQNQKKLYTYLSVENNGLRIKISYPNITSPRASPLTS